jgi:hypothetical protein
MTAWTTICRFIELHEAFLPGEVDSSRGSVMKG